MTTPELHYLLGKDMHRIERSLGVKQPSLLDSCYRYAVPIFVGAVQDGSIFLNIVKLRRLLGEDFKLEIDVNEDVFEMGALQHHCFATTAAGSWPSGSSAAASRRTTRCRASRCSTRSSACRRTASTSTCSSAWTRSTTARLSCARPARGTPGARCPRRAWRPGSVYVHCDVTAVFPWLTYALFSTGARRPPMRLMDQLPRAVRLLDKDVARRRASLMRTIEWNPGKGRPKLPAPGPTVR